LGEATNLLVRWSNGERAALDEVVELLYSQLLNIAAREMRSERQFAVEPTLLVSEVYLRLVQLKRIDWQDRSHFLAMCARIARQTLVDEARRGRAAKRGHGLDVTLTLGKGGITTGGYDIIEVNELLGELETIDEVAAQVTELRLFGGLNIEEAAKELDLSVATVNRKWRSARTWLARELGVSTVT
jgi:RNA polymerase sigma factor (TIGR02999 family)